MSAEDLLELATRATIDEFTQKLTDRGFKFVMFLAILDPSDLTLTRVAGTESIVNFPVTAIPSTVEFMKTGCAILVEEAN